MPTMITMGTERHILSTAPAPGRAPAPRLLLASRSPRRRSLLSDFGVRHDARHPGFDDAVLTPGDVSPAQWVASLAYLKAQGRSEEHIVLGADTVCVKDGRILGTPTDADDARRILRDLSGGTHQVLTGVALIAPGDAQGPPRRQVFVDSATVRMGHLSDAQIDDYIDSGAWHGKAGAYNLAERLEAGWPIEYIGDPTTIMGLPMGRLMPRLRGLGIEISEDRPRA